MVYSLDKLDSKFSIENAAVKEEMWAMQISHEYALLYHQSISLMLALNFRTGLSNPIPRDQIKQGGVMVKETDPQAVFGQPYNAQVRLIIQFFEMLSRYPFRSIFHL